ncbi:hypothetical protein ARHIZOSPH14_04790 [Agromyces rhizosphaerae]|uniref:PH domain-containing protein n=1 Tax=Agromyces rhizosphaerae TaxID=88374 RepID=A0A9W6FQ57_9MICO|nr:hypothetical protein [Agromyces rhizosphaerae]GLI26237.1 hypothetical protein ARHIZOSPH14_04790 [Agromyces rhizosphaerae]
MGDGGADTARSVVQSPAAAPRLSPHVPLVDRPVRVQTLRPRSAVIRGITTPVIGIGLPVVGVLLWTTIPEGEWVPVAVGAAVVGALLATVWLLFRRVAIWVDSTGITERGFFGVLRHAQRCDVDHVVRLDLYAGPTPDTNPQLFVIDRDGRALVRMRGDFWDASAMDVVAPILEVPEHRHREPLTLQDLRASHPELLYWFEKRPRRH